MIRTLKDHYASSTARSGDSDAIYIYIQRHKPVHYGSSTTRGLSSDKLISVDVRQFHAHNIAAMAQTVQPIWATITPVNGSTLNPSFAFPTLLEAIQYQVISRTCSNIKQYPITLPTWVSRIWFSRKSQPCNMKGNRQQLYVLQAKVENGVMFPGCLKAGNPF